ncbi:NmrA family NAD(P)-binding protein [Sulfitobacter sp. F26169L]|nr:NmrA family NAD(P)-binding protein [Sulfitobacter sp. F26169L]
MTGAVLVLGANGRFGRAAAQTFAQVGWHVRAASRNSD